MTQRTLSNGAYRRVLANREARGLLIAQVASEFGDQVARVALALLVLDRTDEIVLSALTLAVAFVPGMFGAAFLGSLADRFPRRAVMLVCDLGRFVLISALAVGALADAPLALLVALLLASEFLTAPFASARASLYPDVLPDPRDFVTAQGMARSVHLSTQVFGSVLGGALVGLLDAPLALAIDAATFLVSFVVIRTTVGTRPSADVLGTSLGRMLSDLGDGARELFSDRLRRSLILLGWGSTLFLVAPEAVSLAYRPELPPAVGGILLAAVPAGSAVGALILPRLPLREQVRLLLPLAALSCLPLFATSIDPAPAVAALLWFVAGFLQAYVLTVIALVTVLTHRERRGRVLGVAAAGFSAATTASFVFAGWLAGIPAIGPARAVSLAGALGLVLVAGLRAIWPVDELESAV